MRPAALALVAALSVASCGGSDLTAPGPASTADNPGPNRTDRANPGPNPTGTALQTINGTFAVVGTCVRLTPRGTGRAYELRLPKTWRVTPAARVGLVVDGRLVAHVGDEVFVAGRVTSSIGRCGTVVVASKLVSVLPQR